MEKNKKNKITDVAIGIAIIVGVAINGLLSKQLNLPVVLNWIITVVVAAVIHEFLFWLFIRIIGHSDFLLKFYWGKLYIKGFWSYTYYVDGVKKYGAWCIDQDLDSISIKGFGLTQDGVRRSDVQSMTSLIQHGHDYEVINMRRDTNDDGSWSDFLYPFTLFRGKN